MDESVPASRPHGARTGSMLAVAAGSAPDRHESPAPFAGSSPATTEPPATARPSLAEMAPVPGANLSTSTPMQATGNAPAPIFSSMAAPVPADMSTPVPSPQFADALGVQVSVLARAGIERAELQLNPASMGPLAVQITLDAGHAQVHFGSDSAQTRQIVEAGFPALAAALRDAGFTLSGGGVSQHPGDPRHQGAAARGATNFGLRLGTASPDDEVRPLRTTRASLGRLDLYA
jgi:flagellar hook-length control protein FliK